jgi:hypothetical protein
MLFTCAHLESLEQKFNFFFKFQLSNIQTISVPQSTKNLNLNIWKTSETPTAVFLKKKLFQANHRRAWSNRIYRSEIGTIILQRF